jgi:hypothetical protein
MEQAIKPAQAALMNTLFSRDFMLYAFVKMGFEMGTFDGLRA